MMDSEYTLKVGDKVRIKHHGSGTCSHRSCASFTESMREYIGKKATIVRLVISSNRYSLDIDSGDCAWSICMLELIRRGRPRKPRPAKFIIIYKTTDGIGKCKVCTTKKDVNDWLKESAKADNIEFKSVVIFDVVKARGVKFSVRLFNQ